MRSLIVEDDLVSQKLMLSILRPYGSCDVASNGEEGVRMFREAFEGEDAYRLVCLDIMMPGMNGQNALKAIRDIEQADGRTMLSMAKIVMTTALTDIDNVGESYRSLCNGYLYKPIRRDDLVRQLKYLGLVEDL